MRIGYRHAGPARDGFVYGVFGPAPVLIGWLAAFHAKPRPDLLNRVRPL